MAAILIVIFLFCSMIAICAREMARAERSEEP